MPGPTLEIGGNSSIPPTALGRRQIWTAMAGVLLAMVLAALDQNIVNTALPRIGEDLGGIEHLSWVVTAFMLTSTVTAPFYGKLSDTYGRRRLFFVAIVIFMAGSLLCGLAQSMDQLIGFRALQGLGAGGLMVLAQAAIGDTIAPRERPRYQGLFTGTMALSSITGPLLGGIITQVFSWRYVFYVNLPVGLLALVMIAIGLRRPPAGIARPIDYYGTLLLTGVTSALLLLLAGGGSQFPWISQQSLALGALSAIGFGLFLWRESCAADPLVRLALFRNPVFSRGVAVSGMMTFAMLGATTFVPTYFQLVLGMAPARAGAMLLPQVAGMLLSSIVGGRIVSRLGRARPFLLLGVGLEATALMSLAVLAYLEGSPALFLFSMACLGLGMGMGMPNVMTSVQNAVAYSELGAATGTLAFVRSLGAALGVAASGSIMASRLAGQADMTRLVAHGTSALSAITPAQQAAISSAYRVALTGSFLLSGVVMTAAFILVLGLPAMVLRSRI
jgi:EmrB/QacA subfamily drug resistance transporter